MKIIHEYPVRVFKKTYEGKDYYRIGLSRKDKDGNYIHGYLDAKFKKDAKVDESKKIYIKDAWLDFYLSDKITKPYIFINQFDYVEEVIEATKKDAFDEFAAEVELKDEDLPF